MERIGIIGVGWREGGVSSLARFTVPRDERPRQMHRLASVLSAEELVYLATCNRVEVLYVDGAGEGAACREQRERFYTTLTGERPRDGELDRIVRCWHGEDALRHAISVASGLEAARPGETEIVGQIREAVETSRRESLLGPELEFLAAETLRSATHVRRASGLESPTSSLAELALAHVGRRLALTDGAVALVGVSPMTRRCARRLAAEGRPLVIVNRGARRREGLAARIGALATDLDSFRAAPPPVEVIVSATGAPEPVLRRADLERLAARTRSAQPPLIVDLALPPDVDASDARAAGCPRIGLEHLLPEADRTRHDRREDLADARLHVDESLVRLRGRLAERRVAPLLGALQQRYRRTAVEGVDRLLARGLESLDADERRAVREWAITLARRFAHIPSLGLRGLARESGTQGVEAFLSGLDEGLARDLRRAGAGRTRSRRRRAARPDADA